MSFLKESLLVLSFNICVLSSFTQYSLFFKNNHFRFKTIFPWIREAFPNFCISQKLKEYKFWSLIIYKSIIYDYPHFMDTISYTITQQVASCIRAPKIPGTCHSCMHMHVRSGSGIAKSNRSSSFSGDLSHSFSIFSSANLEFLRLITRNSNGCG